MRGMAASWRRRLGCARWAHYSSYLHAASRSPQEIANRPVMLDYFLKDVKRLGSVTLPPPERRPGSVRLATWNLNSLCGADGRSPTHAVDAFDVMQSLDADVLALQEVPVVHRHSMDEEWARQLGLSGSQRRCRGLDALLSGAGYKLLRSHATNPTLLATKLPVRTAAAFHIDEKPVRSINSGELWSESRGAVLGDIETPGLNGPLAVYATHLHHNDVEVQEGGSLCAGVRRRQASALLRHWQTREKAVRKAAATFILADFNQPLKEHYSDDEWRCVAAGLTHPDVAQPEEDGVAQLLASHGFRSAYDHQGRDDYGERRAPTMTHWTGTTIDFAYVHLAPGSDLRVLGTHVHYTSLSDHLPVVVDFGPAPGNNLQSRR